MEAVERYDVIIPIAEKDVEMIKIGMPFFKEMLPIKQLIVIGNKSVLLRLEKCGIKDDVKFIEEDSILSFAEVREYIRMISNGNEDAVKRCGWYLQQFLKMMYANICEDEYYLVWDADTIPVRSIKMVNDNVPVFHMKEEYYPSYFETMGRLIPGLKKLESKSFIAEHMLISTEIMRNLMTEIEKNNELNGNKFWQKILQAIDKDMLAHSGFSEFETYGNYCELRYSSKYRKEEYKSLREGSKYFEQHEFTNREAEWLAEEYMAVSFEKGMVKVSEYKLYKNAMLQKMFHFGTMYSIGKNTRKRIQGMKKGIKKLLGIKR